MIVSPASNGRASSDSTSRSRSRLAPSSLRMNRLARLMSTSGSFSPNARPGTSSALSISVEQQKAVWKMKCIGACGAASAAAAISAAGWVALRYWPAKCSSLRNISSECFSRGTNTLVSIDPDWSKVCGSQRGSRATSRAEASANALDLDSVLARARQPEAPEHAALDDHLLPRARVEPGPVVGLRPHRAVVERDGPPAVRIVPGALDDAVDLADLVIAAEQSAEVRNGEAEQRPPRGARLLLVDHVQVLVGDRLAHRRGFAVVTGESLVGRGNRPARHQSLHLRRSAGLNRPCRSGGAACDEPGSGKQEHRVSHRNLVPSWSLPH